MSDTQSLLLLALGILMLTPALWPWIRLAWRCYMQDPLIDWLYQKPSFRRWRGGCWFDVRPKIPEHALDRYGWRRQPPKKEDRLVSEERYH